MSTLDKINNELGVLQGELEQLHHYTVEIGNAKEASASVIAMSREFLVSFQKRIQEIDSQIAKSSEDFQNHSGKVSESFNSSLIEFKNGISQAKNSLNEISIELSGTAKNVNGLTKKVDDINIPSHFQRIHSSFEALTQAISENQQNMMSRVDGMESRLVSETKRLNTWLIVNIVLGGLAMIGIGILLAK